MKLSPIPHPAVAPEGASGLMRSSWKQKSSQMATRHSWLNKCADPFSNDNGCTLCIKYCPFSYADYDKLKVKFKSAH